MSTTTVPYEKVLQLSRKQRKKQISWRRHLHQHPETANEEHLTTAFLKKELKKLGARVIPLKMKTGVLAEISGHTKGPIVAMRSDIDALPVTEKTALSFASRRPGFMHACGHDMHMATLLGAVSVLADLRDQLPGTVRFLFQPAEEQPPGGARPMIAEGVLKKVSAIFGLHVDPHLPTGKISLRDGASMASVYDFDIEIFGRSGHAARPQQTVDAIVVATEVVQSLQTIVSREIDPTAPIVITFGKISGGTVRNVIADRVHLVGTARTLSPTTFKKVPLLIKRTLGGVCRARGAKFALHEIASYPVLSNHASINRVFANNYAALFGKSKIAETSLLLGGEDFACYLQKVPGAMFRLGVQNKNIGADKPWHSPQFVADEDALVVGTSLLAASAIDYLNDHPK